ncbi:MAG: hypothetical protein ACD_47C00320G0001 [uncultured bacterium]|nr:MAG: hypothetical protein ACD_47C00320G0001 [uncultured bacterium]
MPCLQIIFAAQVGGVVIENDQVKGGKASRAIKCEN